MKKLWFKGTIIQIWKSASMFVFVSKKYVEDVTLKRLLLFEISVWEIILQTFVYKHSETKVFIKN